MWIVWSIYWKSHTTKKKSINFCEVHVTALFLQNMEQIIHQSSTMHIQFTDVMGFY